MAGGARRHRAADIAGHRVARGRTASADGNTGAGSRLDPGKEQADNGAFDRDRVEIGAKDWVMS
jgi:hypothetical protein